MLTVVADHHADPNAAQFEQSERFARGECRGLVNARVVVHAKMRLGVRPDDAVWADEDAAVPRATIGRSGHQSQGDACARRGCQLGKGSNGLAVDALGDRQVVVSAVPGGHKFREDRQVRALGQGLLRKSQRTRPICRNLAIDRGDLHTGDAHDGVRYPYWKGRRSSRSSGRSTLDPIAALR